MSTFNGIVEEFPHIRIDYFRKNPDKPPPLACFLSHVHSDHLQGLESLRAPFIYCSAATREILLRIEKYPHRMNFSKGILESRKQHYKHLGKLLRPIPLHVPTEIELMPGNRLRVTLFDANHCPGAVMFLIEGDGKSILYTGDIRAENWWVDNLIRNPILVPYTLGVKRLDKLYLDTTFAVKSNIYAEFPSKAEGIRELIEQVQKYPDDTIFYLRSWTFGYEEVWQSLSNVLNTQVHVDRYQLGLYKSLKTHVNVDFGSNEGLYLCGFSLGNAHIPGCLTDSKSTRIHSCEPGDVCSTVSTGKSVYITPIVTRADDGSEVLELGTGGGLGDLYQIHELELPDDSAIQQLITLCAEQVPNANVRAALVTALTDAYSSKSKSLPLGDYGIKEADEISLQRLVQMLSRGTAKQGVAKCGGGDDGTASESFKADQTLPKTIRFPYSRHSSYAELCLLVKAFKPKDIIPCTVDTNTWCEEVSMQHLFGHLCSASEFSHDDMMRETVQKADSRPWKRARHDDDSADLSTQHSSIQTVVNWANNTQSNSLNLTAQPHTATQAEKPNGNSAVKTEESAVSQQTYSSAQITTTSQLSLPGSDTFVRSSPTSKLRAIRQALQEKAQNHEIKFYLPPSLAAESQRSIASTVSKSDAPPHRKENPPPPSSSPAHPPIAEAVSTALYVNHDTLSDSESMISLSPSAFDSQPTNIVQCQEDLEPDKTARDSSKPRPPTSRERRMAAYRATRDGNFEAWLNFYSPVTAGNNHSEEDAEL